MTRLSASEDDLLAIHRNDDAWFKANPNRSYHLRRAYAIEAGAAKRHAGPPASKISYVIIGQIPGRQVRRIVEFAYEMIDSEELARDLFNQFIGTFERPPVYWLLPKPSELRRAYGRGDRA
jgi:hypothetical protein